MVSSGEIMENKRPLLSMPRRPDTILRTQESTLALFGGDKALRGTPGCPECLRAMPGYDKWSAQRHNAIYYNYSLIESNDGITATQTRHGDSYYEDYFPDLLTNRTLAMIKEFTSQEGERRPFLAVNAWPTPHGPFTPGTYSSYKTSSFAFCLCSIY